MYEDIKDSLMNIAIEGIESIAKSDIAIERKYGKIRYIIEATEDVLNQIYDITKKIDNTTKGETK